MYGLMICLIGMITISFTCSSTCILCTSGSIPRSILHGARNFWQRVNGQWNCGRTWSAWGPTCHQGHWKCCCQTPSCSQGKCQEGHVLLLSYYMHPLVLDWNLKLCSCIKLLSLFIWYYAFGTTLLVCFEQWARRLVFHLFGVFEFV